MSKLEPLVFEADIDPSTYIRIPETNTVIEKRQTVNDKTYNEFQELAGERKLTIATAALFMPHYVRARDAAAGKTTLYDGNNKPISVEEASTIWNYLNKEAWIYLNGRFVKGSGFNGLDLVVEEHQVKKKGNVTEIIIRKVSAPVQEHANLNGLVELSFNKQGLPTRKSQSEAYEIGKNLYFYKPIEDAVAGFDADSDRADLYCSRNADFSDSQLGVLGCAEGTQKNLRRRLK